jgi:hypothetical protein
VELIELSGKSLNQDVVIMTGGNLNQRITYLTNLNKRFCGEIHASTLLTLKQKQEALFTFMEVQDKSIKKHFWGTIVEKK